MAAEALPGRYAISHRRVGPSNKAGSAQQARVGAVAVRRSTVAICSDCGGTVLDLVRPGYHSVRHVGSELVNCSDRVVSEDEWRAYNAGTKRCCRFYRGHLGACVPSEAAP